MNKITLLRKIKHKSLITLNDIPEKLLFDRDILDAVKNFHSELFIQEELMKLFYIHLKNKIESINEDNFMFLCDEYQKDNEILQKCNPDIWDWSEDGINHYKSISRKIINK
jgi:hypothetical protein